LSQEKLSLRTRSSQLYARCDSLDRRGSYVRVSDASEAVRVDDVLNVRNGMGRRFAIGLVPEIQIV